MKDLFKHLETFGVSFAESRAAGDYARAATEDELDFAAGEQLAAHATAIVDALRLPFGSRSAAANSAFCVSALVDLCAVRNIFKEHKRWPELSQLLDRILVMACANRSHAIGFSESEQKVFYDQATDYLIDFQDDESRAPQIQIDRLMSLEAVAKDRIDLTAFIKAALADPTWIDPWAVMKHHDRLAKSRP